jgi:Putative transposase/Transposase zinc-binding domain
MCTSSQTPCGPANSLRSRASIDRSDQPQDPGYRLRQDAIEGRSGQGTQGSIRSDLAKAAQGTEGLLADRQASDLPLSRKDPRRSTSRSNDPNLLQDGSRSSPTEQTRNAAHFKTFLCDGTLGGRSRLDGNQQIVGPQQLRDDDGLSALPQTTSWDRPQSDRLAASQAMPQMGRSDFGTRFDAGTGATGGTDGNASETLSVHDILRRYTPLFFAKQGDSLAWQVESTLTRIGYCRTKSLGSHVYHCGQCDHRVTVHNSCGDRNCPQCAGARRASWIDKTAGLLLPDMPYFQVVFTIPDTLSSLVLGNRRELYNLLFRSAWGSLNQSIRKENGQQASAAMVLHTWNQKLEHHPHVHALVPGAAPSLDGTAWVPHRMTKGTIHEKPVPFLVDNKRLGLRFRDKFVAGIERLVKNGKLEVVDMNELKKIIANLSDRDWVVYIEGPPTATSSPEHVLKYLARYLTGGPISDRRLIGDSDGMVSFLARKGDGSDKQIQVDRTGVEFVRLWSLHILPKRFTKSRIFGGWSNNQRSSFLDRCRNLRSSLEPTAQSQPVEEPKKPEEKEARVQVCPKCESEMKLESSQQRPSWRILFTGPDHEEWQEWMGSG